jgi:hypothetical protein
MAGQFFGGLLIHRIDQLEQRLRTMTAEEIAPEHTTLFPSWLKALPWAAGMLAAFRGGSAGDVRFADAIENLRKTLAGRVLPEWVSTLERVRSALADAIILHYEELARDGELPEWNDRILAYEAELEAALSLANMVGDRVSLARLTRAKEEHFINRILATVLDSPGKAVPPEGESA